MKDAKLRLSALGTIAVLLALIYVYDYSRPVLAVTPTTYAERINRIQDEFDLLHYSANAVPPSISVKLQPYCTDRDVSRLRRWLHDRGFYVEKIVVAEPVPGRPVRKR